MSFNSYTFIFAFLPVTLLGYYLLRRFGRSRISVAWLIAASLVFYGWFSPIYVGSVVGSIILNYILGLKIRKPVTGGNQKAFLILGISLNLALMGYFKYTNFFIDNINLILGSNLAFHHIILPLAVSFFTLHQVSYLIDVYRSEISNHDFLDYSLFVAFFPKLLAGPIVRYNEFFPQQANDSNTRFDRDTMVIGLSTFFIGLFKKVILAESVASTANLVFTAASAQTGLTFISAWTGALAYALQLYFDFSGYSDMAIGLGLMFGFRLPLNFYSPYKAIDAIDFWRRWHISLSRFFRDYLYIPLGGNRLGPVRRSFNLVLTMLVAGLWHGAGWTFIIWGALHGVYLVTSHAWRDLQKLLHWDISRSSWPLIAVSVLVTFMAMTVAWVFFRAENLHTAVDMLGGMLGLNGVGVAPGIVISTKSVLWIALGLLLCWFAPNSQEFMSNYRAASNAFSDKPGQPRYRWLRWRPNLIGALSIASMTVLGVIGLTQASTFIYFRF